MKTLPSPLRLLPLLLAAIACAQSKPDFSGTWAINAAKSDMAGNQIPELTLTIRHRDPEVLVAHAMNGQNVEMKFTTDGKESVNELPQGTMKSTYQWEKETLSGVTDFAGQMTFKDHWTLEEGGRLLRITRHVTAQQGEQDWVLVFDKK